MPSTSYIAPSINRHELGLCGADFILETEPTATLENNGSPTKNLLGKELQSALKPMNLMQAVYFCAKYKIQDNMITTNSVFYNIVSVFTFFIVTWCSYYFTFASILSFDERGFKYYQQLAKMYAFFMLCMGSLLNCCTNIIQRHNNVLFVVRIQAICTCLEINEILKRMVFPNWVSVIALNFYHIVWVIFSHYVIDFVDLKLGLSFTSYVWLSFDMNILYATKILQLLTNSLISWVKNVKLSEHVEHLENENYWRKIFEVYMEILEAYKLFGKTFYQLILFYMAVTTSKSLICIVIRIEMKKVTIASNSYFAILSFLSLTWIIKNMLLFILLSVESEKFFSAMTEVQSICTQLTNSSTYSSTQKRVCKNIQRVQKTSFKKMHACGLFIIDAALSLRLCALITTYTIVILQFEFL